MIPELLKLQSDIAERCTQVGRILQSAKHYATVDTPFPAAVPFLGSISDDYVNIVIGRHVDGSYAVIAFPIGLFETAGEADIRVWAFSQNHKLQLARHAQENSDAAATRRKEIAIMSELMAKYPEEVH